VLHHGGHRPLVEPQLGVGQIVVVEQQHVRRANTGQLGQLRGFANDVHLELFPADQTAVGAIVQTDTDPVGAQSRVTGRRLLADHDPLVAAVGADRHVRTQRVDLGGLQPLGGELAQLPPGGRLQFGQQIVEGGVAPGVLAEVRPQASQERFLAHVRDELLEYACALGVRDPVEVDLDRLQVRHLAVDRVGGGELVLPVAPVLSDGQEGGPRLGEAGRVGVAPVAGPLGERLVQPEVVPPAHGDQVAEPHVRHLVQDRVGALLVLEVGDLRPEDVVRLGVRDTAEVLHRARVEVRHPELVVLG